jgi:hypothetical protein
VKRWIALATAALVAVPMVAGPVEAAAVDPVRAVKQEVRPGHGVRISEATRLGIGKTEARFYTRATMEFGQTYPIAAASSQDFVTDVPRAEGDLSSRAREGFVVDGVAYISGELFDLPPGKSWVSLAMPGFSANVSSQTIDVFKPAVLGAVLKGATRDRVAGGFLFRGAVSYARLLKASKSTYSARFRGMTARELKGEISWRLWTDGRGLPRRLIAPETQKIGKAMLASRIDTRYTDWGVPVSIMPPSADLVVPLEDLLPFGDSGLSRLSGALPFAHPLPAAVSR